MPLPCHLPGERLGAKIAEVVYVAEIHVHGMRGQIVVRPVAPVSLVGRLAGAARILLTDLLLIVILRSAAGLT